MRNKVYDLRCKCGNKVLVSTFLVGANHNGCVSVVCSDCLKNEFKINEEWAKENPQRAKEIEEFIKSQPKKTNNKMKAKNSKLK